MSGDMYFKKISMQKYFSNFRNHIDEKGLNSDSITYEQRFKTNQKDVLTSIDRNLTNN